MKREIKFRAFHKPIGEMYWFDIMDGTKSNTGGGYIAMAPFGEDITKTIYKDNMRPIDPQDCELMQFTGLLDKNGKEIYEGDVLKIFNTEGFGVVKFFACSFMVEWVGQDCYSDLLGWYNFKRGAVSKPEDFEIIGNIYENLNLIN